LKLYKSVLADDAHVSPA